MMGFTLSKINLLIFVTAIFTIVVFFTFSLQDTLIVNKASQVVDRYAGEVQALINSSASCNITDTTVPNSIAFFSDNQELFYLMRIKSLDGIEENEPNHLIFSIEKRAEQGNAIAARRIDTTAIIRLFEYNSETGLIEENRENPQTILDPQSAPSPISKAIIVKEIYNGQEYVYIISCTPETCFTNRERVSCILYQERGVEQSCLHVDKKTCCSLGYDVGC